VTGFRGCLIRLVLLVLLASAVGQLTRSAGASDTATGSLVLVASSRCWPWIANVGVGLYQY
jgi:hypothetical protein